MFGSGIVPAAVVHQLKYVASLDSTRRSPFSFLVASKRYP